MINIFVTDLKGKEHNIDAPTNMGINLMEAIKANGLPLKATCGGMAMCASCSVIVKSNNPLNKMSEAEEAMLDEAFILDVVGCRLSCQIPITEDLDQLHVQLGKLTDPEE